MPGNTIGTAYVQILPSTRGISAALTKQLAPAAQKAGKDAGGKIGSALGTKLQSTGGKMSAIGKSMSKVSLPVAAVGIAAAGTAMKFEKGMSKVQAITGASGKDMKTLENLAISMGNKTQFSASESAEAMTYMGMAGWKTKDITKGLAGVMNLAAASGEDLGTTSDIVTDSLTAFGMKAKDSNKFADLLAKTATTTNTNVRMMGETFKYVAPAAGALGYSANDVAKGVGLMANGGIKASQAGTSLRMGLLSMAKPSKQAATMMERYGISLKDSNGKMKPFSTVMQTMRDKLRGLPKDQQAAALSAIVGKNAYSGWANIVNASQKDFDKTTRAIDNNKGAAEKMAKTMNNNAAGSITYLKSALETLAIKLGKIMIPTITQIVKKITELVNKFASAPAGVQKFVTVFGLIVAAAGPVLAIVGKATSMVGRLIMVAVRVGPALAGMASSFGSAITAIGGLFAKMGAFLLANPIILIIAGIAVAAFLIYKNWDKVKGLLIKVWNAIKKVAVVVWNGIKAAISGPIMLAVKLVTARIRLMLKISMTIFNAILALAYIAWLGIKFAIIKPMAAAYARIRKILFAVRKVFVTIFNAVKKFVSAVWKAIRNLAVRDFKAVQTAITRPLSAAKSAVSRIVSAIKSAVSKAWNAVKKKTQQVFNALKSAVSKPLGKVKSTVSSAVSRIKSIFGRLKSITGSVRRTFNSIKSAITNPISDARAKVKSALGRIKNMFPLSVGKIFTNIRLPHVGVNGGKAPYGIGGKGRRPSFSVTWAARGGIIDGAQLIGAGEAGKEAIIPLERNTGWMDTLADRINGQSNTFNVTMTVNGADDPAAWADKFVKTLKRKARMGV